MFFRNVPYVQNEDDCLLRSDDWMRCARDHERGVAALQLSPQRFCTSRRCECLAGAETQLRIEVDGIWHASHVHIRYERAE